MGPKQRKRDTSQTDLNKRKNTIDAPVPTELTDNINVVLPYLELRYTPQAESPPLRRPDPRFEKMYILKKKRLPPSVLVTLKNKEIVTSVTAMPVKLPVSSTNSYSRLFKCRETDHLNQLNINAINSKPLLKWFGPGELPLIPPPIAVLRRTPKVPSTYNQKLESSLKKEHGLLQMFEKVQLVIHGHQIETCEMGCVRSAAVKRIHDNICDGNTLRKMMETTLVKVKELEMENYLMKKTGKTRQNLILRKQQNLPHIDNIGEEITHMIVERTVTPEFICDTAIFSEAARKNREKNDIRRTLTRREKGYNIVRDWVGCPDVTDIISERLGLRSKLSVAMHPKPEESIPLEDVDDFIPKFEELGVVGLSYREFQKGLNDIMKSKITTENPKYVFTNETLKVKSDGKKESSRGYYVKENTSASDESVAGLIIGQVKISWTRDPERSNKTWVIDLGCAAEIGKDSIGSIHMKNIGTTSVHFQWEKIPPANVFQLKKYALRRFAFDCWGSVILPGETFRIPVLYKCIEPGFYSEDWLLITQPVMENGATIITRLWGITRQYDPYRQIRQAIETNLETKMAKAIVEHRVKKIVDFLPLKEVPLKDTRFALVHLGIELFQLNNPWLKYHCASVFRLGKLAAMTENKKERAPLVSIPERSGTSLLYTDIGESVSDIPATSKHSTSVDSIEQIFTARNDEDNIEDYTRVDKSVIYNDTASFFSDDDAVTSLSHIKRLIEEQVSPEIPVPMAMAQEPNEDEADFSEMGTKIKRPLAVNLTNPDIFVNQIRENILSNIVDSEEYKEAYFLIMSDQVSRLLFRTDTPIDNWKMVIARNLLCNAMDVFSEFAAVLQDKCCEGQMHQDIFIAPEEKSSTSIKFSEQIEDEEEEIFSEVSDDEEQSLTLSTPKACENINPRRALQYLRYQDEYYSRLFCRMYMLLSDLAGDLDNLLSEAKELHLNQADVGFTRVRNIPMTFSEDDVLNAPLPPSWVKLAQRMDNTVQKNRARKESQND